MQSIGMAMYGPVLRFEDLAERVNGKLAPLASGNGSAQQAHQQAAQFDPYVALVVGGVALAAVACIGYAIHRSYRHLPRY